MLANHIPYLDVTYHRIVLPRLALLVIEIDHYGFLHLADHGVTDVNVLHHAAANGVGLDADAALQVGAAHHVVVGKYIAHTTGNFASHDDTAMARLHLTIANDDVLGRHTQPPSVIVAAGLDGDAVIAGIENTVLDEHVPAAFRVTTVGIGTLALQ